MKYAKLSNSAKAPIHEARCILSPQYAMINPRKNGVKSAVTRIQSAEEKFLTKCSQPLLFFKYFFNALVISVTPPDLSFHTFIFTQDFQSRLTLVRCQRNFSLYIHRYKSTKSDLHNCIRTNFFAERISRINRDNERVDQDRERERERLLPLSHTSVQSSVRNTYPLNTD